MSVYEGFKLILNCDFVAVADRKFCQIFYGKEKLLEEDIAAYSFYDDESFEAALKLARHFSRSPYFEKMWSAKKFDDQPGGYICMKRLEGLPLARELADQDRNEQFSTCITLARAIAELHQNGIAHGALDEENVLFDRHYRIPVILETITVNFKDQLESANLAPEQVDSEALLIPTDVFWFGNLYLRKIKAPGRGLKRLISRCTATDPAVRPSIENVLQELLALSRTTVQAGHRLRIQPKRIGQVAALFLALGAGVVGFKSWQTNRVFTHRDARAIQFLNTTMAKAESLPTISEKIRFLRTTIPKTSSTVQKSILINNIREYLQVSDHPLIIDINSSILGVFILPVPMVVTQEATLGLGSIIETQNEQGYLFDLQKHRIFFQTARGSSYLEISHPYMLSTTVRDTSNIFVPGGHENMRTLLYGIAEFYGFNLVDEGGRDGIISGHFTAADITDFLQKASEPLGLEFSDHTITILNTDDLRIHAPVRQLGLGRFTDFPDLMAFLAGPTGYQLAFENLGELATLNIRSMYVHDIPWKDLLKELGAAYRLEDHNGQTTLVIYGGAAPP